MVGTVGRQRAWLASVVSVAVATVLLLASNPASAQPDAAAPDSGADKPWARGVSEDARKRAFAEFDRGNKFFERSQYVEALRAYQVAIKEWDHPAIRYNMTVCQINLDQPIEALRNLRLALRYDQGPLSDDVYKQATTYRKLLTNQLSNLTVKCSQAGAVVSVDGARWTTCPGEETRLLRPGEHQIVAELDDHVTRSEKVTLIGGRNSSTAITLLKVGEVKFETRYPRWLPWTTLGAGVAIAALAVPLQLSANTHYDRFDAGVAIDCPDGCADSGLEPETREHRDRADLRRNLAIASVAVGGAAVLTGVVLLVMNRPRPVDEDRGIDLQPTVGPGAVGAVISGSF